jgi:hypothetical protein
MTNRYEWAYLLVMCMGIYVRLTQGLTPLCAPFSGKAVTPAMTVVDVSHTPRAPQTLRPQHRPTEQLRTSGMRRSVESDKFAFHMGLQAVVCLCHRTLPMDWLSNQRESDISFSPWRCWQPHDRERPSTNSIIGSYVINECISA